MRFVVLMSLILITTACGGGHAPSGQLVTPDGGPAAANSQVVLPVSEGTVTAYRYDGAVRGAAIGSTQTDAIGAFDLQLSAPATGPILVVVSSGSYTEPATGTPVLVEGYEITAVVGSQVRAAGDSFPGLVVSPISHLVAQLVRRYVAGGATVEVALSQAQTLLNSHFGGIDWTSISPPDLTGADAGSIVQLNDAAKAALILTGLSAEAKNLAQAKSLTAGGPLNSLTLLSTLASDLSGDGYFDGYGASNARLSVPPSTANAYALDGQTVRSTLAQGISTFLSSSRNGSHIALTDAQPLMNGIASDANGQLFRDQGGSVDIIPPTITFVQPAPNASVQGQLIVEATATDDVAMGTFAFTDPASLAAAQPTVENGGKTLRLKTALNVSALPDGQLTVSVAATDHSLNTATQTLTLRVANHGPVISITGPASGQSTRGTVTVSATGTGQNGAIVTKLALLNPPPGCGADTLPAADSLSMTWDTTKALEGPYTLQFEATDSYGAVSDMSVPVVVDNIPFGVVTAHVTAGGTPISGATVSIYAVDNTTGLPSSSVGTGGLLGICNATDSTGVLACTLTVENYQGPIQVTAGGPGLNYTDPSDGATVISIPQTFSFGSYIGNYKTGDSISVPLSLWTTLADGEALAIVQGRHRAQPAALLTDALATVDPLFENHLSTTVAWDLRSTIPISLTTSAQSLRDVVYAALPDLALNQIARDRSAAASVTPGGVITAVTLAQLLQQDLGADGQFDGLGAGGQQLQTAGNPAQKLDANWLRYFMAKALDEWFQTAPNKTGLLSSDIQNAGVFDTVANDTSILFGSSLAPVPYDNAPPTISLSATYHAADGNDYAPYGSSRAVSGRLDLSVTALDTSGVASLTVQELSPNTLTLSPGVGSSMPTHFIGSLSTTAVADGNVTIGTTEIDRLGNAGATQSMFFVDNTPPSVQVTQPIAGTFYTSVIPADVAATDTDGILSLAETSLNITDNDQTVPHFFGSYVIPSTTPEGSLSPTFKACDNVHNCQSVPVPVSYDRTPPQLSIPVAPPRYTNQATLSLSVNASDGAGAGVAAVYAQNGTSPAVSALPSGGVATLSIALNHGDNTVVLWAVDNAVSWNSGVAGPGNSGKGLAAPYQLTVQVLYDNTAPSPALTNIVSYYDETNMQASVNADGSPVMPAAYTYGGASLHAVDTTGATPVNKAITRMNYAGAQPSAASLVGTNPRNLPFLAFVIPYIAGTDSPIASSTYSATVTCASCGTLPTASGSLILDTTYTSGVRYLLPVAFDSIPALQQVTGLAQVTVTVTAQDAAGNSGSTVATPASFKYQAFAPPPIFAEDQSYASANDLRGVYTMKINNGTYGRMLGYSGLGPEGVRFVRYVAYNSETTPYAITSTLDAISGDPYHISPAAENWEAWSDYAPGNVAGYPICYDYPGGDCGYTGNPCGSGLNIFAPDGTLLGCSTSTWSPGNRTNPEAKIGGGALAVGAYQVSGNNEVAPANASNGSLLVPSATGATPGQLNVYLAMPIANESRDPRAVSPIDWNTTFNRYQELYATYPAGNGPSGECDCDPDSGRCAGFYECWAGESPWYQYLNAADSKLFGTITATSYGILPNTSTVAGTSRATAAVTFSRDIPN